MSVEPYTKFKAVSDFNKALLSEEIEQNLKWWSRWAFLQTGAWADVEIPTSGLYGGTFHLLHRVEDPNYDDGQVWETPKKELVYETGVNFNGSGNPIQISGVWINNSFYATSGNSTYPHYIDYENGHVIFDTAIDIDDTVAMNYSYRTVSVNIADDSPLWKEIQQGSDRVEDDHLGSENGEWTGIPALRRQQLPAAIIEIVPRSTNKGHELGSTVLRTDQDILIHVVAESRAIRNRVADCYRFEQDHVIWLFNSDDIAAEDWPLDYRGMVNSSGLMYPDLIEEYKWLNMWFKKTVGAEFESISPRLHLGTVRLTAEVIFGRDV